MKVSALFVIALGVIAAGQPLAGASAPPQWGLRSGSPPIIRVQAGIIAREVLIRPQERVLIRVVERDDERKVAEAPAAADPVANDITALLQTPPPPDDRGTGCN